MSDQPELPHQSGGITISATDVATSGDVTGRNKITNISTTNVTIQSAIPSNASVENIIALTANLSREEQIQIALKWHTLTSKPDLSRVNLSYASLRGVNLMGANLSGADLSNVDLVGANLRNANLSGADLRSAKLRAANLSGAIFRGANLDWADLLETNLEEADTTGADFGYFPDSHLPHKFRAIRRRQAEVRLLQNIFKAFWKLSYIVLATILGSSIGLIVGQYVFIPVYGGKEPLLEYSLLLGAMLGLLFGFIRTME